MQLEMALLADPSLIHLSVLWGRRDYLVKIIWRGQQEPCQFSNRLSQGRVAWLAVKAGGC